MQINYFFQAVWNNIRLLTNVVPSTDSVPERIYKLTDEVDPIRVEEALLWIADATIGREGLYIHDGGDPAQVVGQLNLIAQQFRVLYPSKLECTDLRLWSDLLAGLALAYLAPKSSVFLDTVAKKPNSIYELVAA
ncbi:hypothetical protein C4546_04290 [Candidatus Parcubacteria bacterium]|jgi:hypothetical protein|nr:MAG: hypothetical protein C4546_04290 [Candidatus Parcubacteria bacterium]